MHHSHELNKRKSWAVSVIAAQSEGHVVPPDAVDAVCFPDPPLFSILSEGIVGGGGAAPAAPAARHRHARAQSAGSVRTDPAPSPVPAAASRGQRKKTYHGRTPGLVSVHGAHEGAALQQQQQQQQGNRGMCPTPPQQHARTERSEAWYCKSYLESLGIVQDSCPAVLTFQKKGGGVQRPVRSGSAHCSAAAVVAPRRGAHVEMRGLRSPPHRGAAGGGALVRGRTNLAIASLVSQVRPASSRAPSSEALQADAAFPPPPQDDGGRARRAYLPLPRHFPPMAPRKLVTPISRRTSTVTNISAECCVP